VPQRIGQTRLNDPDAEVERSTLGVGERERALVLASVLLTLDGITILFSGSVTWTLIFE